MLFSVSPAVQAPDRRRPAASAPSAVIPRSGYRRLGGRHRHRRRQTGKGLRLLHAKANHAKSLPETQAKPFKGAPTAAPRKPAEQKLSLRDPEGGIHYLSVGDVWYIKAENTVCRLVTTNGVFCCRLPLGAPDQPPFLRIHKSYLCSPAYVHSPRCCRIVVQNGAELPVGKERYNDVKLILRQSV